jgi:subtilase family serine protease
MAATLAAGTEATLNIVVPALPSVAAGTYYLGAFADSTNSINESDESNNTRFANPTAVTYAPDLVITAITPPAAATIGKPVTVPVTVKNQGVGTTGRNFTVGLYLCSDSTISPSCSRIAYPTVTTLAAGAEATLNIVVPAMPSVTAGTYYIGAFADSVNVINESDETNNTRFANSTTVTYAPDLVITAITPPASATIGKPVTVPVTVKNQGVGTTGRNFTVGLYLCSDSTISPSCSRIAYPAVATLAAGAEATLNIVVPAMPSVTAGAYYLGAIADSNNVINESDETNNSLAPGAATMITK